jgi:hypothetical protein
MSFADDLLEQAYHLAHREVPDPKQASLRRAVSTAYYALFHLLINEAVGKWVVERQRSILARTFEHGKMKGICENVLKIAKSGGAVPPELVIVAQNFVVLQQERQLADYDNSKHWSRTDAVAVLAFASNAFTAWRAISAQGPADDFPLRLFLPKPPRQ